MATQSLLSALHESDKINQMKADLSVNNKVDKVSGKGLSTEDFTTALKDKLALTEGDHFKGVHASLADLETAYPAANVKVGGWAYLKNGADAETMALLDNGAWVEHADGGAGPLTAAQIKSLYESNAETNALTDALKTVLGFISATKAFNADVTQDNLTAVTERTAGLGATPAKPADANLDLKVDHIAIATPIVMEGTQDLDAFTLAQLLASKTLITVGNAVKIEVALKQVIEAELAKVLLADGTTDMKTGYAPAHDLSIATKKTVADAVAGLVAKVTGKDLSSNDYTDAEKTKVGSALQSHQDISNLVAKVAGKALSKNDYTDADKAKVGSALQAHQDITAYAKTADMNTELAKKADKDIVPVLPTADGEYKLKIASGVATWESI